MNNSRKGYTSANGTRRAFACASTFLSKYLADYKNLRHRMMGMNVIALPLSISLLISPYAIATDMPAVLFESGGKTEITLGTPIKIRSELVQIQIGSHWILSARRGTEFQIHHHESNGKYVIHIESGDAMLLDLMADSISLVRPGSFLSGPGEIPCAGVSTTHCLGFQAHTDTSAVELEAADFHINSFENQKNLAFSSAIMIRQQGYLDSLRIDIRDINSIFGSILRSFAPRQSR